MQARAQTGLIICGALAHEVLALVARHGWDADVVAVPAIDHAFPDRIAPDVEQKIVDLRARYRRLFVVYGDCGTRGALDEVLRRYDIQRIDGPHCYEMYGGDLFHELMAEAPGTFFLTDYMVRTFRGMIVKSMGLDRYPTLRQEYFRNYTRIVYLVQRPEPVLLERAKAVAAYLGLPLEVRATGYNGLERRLAALFDDGRAAAGGVLGEVAADSDTAWSRKQHHE